MSRNVEITKDPSTGLYNVNPNKEVSTSYAFFYWHNSDEGTEYLTKTATPTTSDIAYVYGTKLQKGTFTPYEITAVGEGTITVDGIVQTRDTTNDFTIFA